MPTSCIQFFGIAYQYSIEGLDLDTIRVHASNKDVHTALCWWGFLHFFQFECRYVTRPEENSHITRQLTSNDV